MAKPNEPIKHPKLHLLRRKMELVWLLAWEGYEDLEIGEMMNGMDRTWVYRLRTRMPKGWEPRLEKLPLQK